MLSNNEKYIFTSELALAVSNGLQVEDGLKMLAGFDANVSICAKKLEDMMKKGSSFTDALKHCYTISPVLLVHVTANNFTDIHRMVVTIAVPFVTNLF